MPKRSGRHGLARQWAVLGLAGLMLAAVAYPHEALAQCAGDCDGNARVTIAELRTAIDIALGQQATNACGAADIDRNARVTIEELVAAVTSAQLSCGMTPSPMVTPSPSMSPTPSLIPSVTSTPTPPSTRTATPTTTGRTPTPTTTLPPSPTPSSTPTFSVTPTSSPTTPPQSPTPTSAYPAPIVSGLNPSSGPVGALVTINGQGFVPAAGVARLVRMPKQGGGSIEVPIGNADNTKLQVTIPAGADSGPMSVFIDGQSATNAPVFTVTRPSFSLAVAPGSASVMRGFKTAATVSLSGSNGFSQLARLRVEGLPADVTATFKPAYLGAGQSAVIEIAAAVNAAVGTSMLRVIAEETVDGRPLRQEGPLALTVQAVTTSFLGRVVEDDATQKPIPGVRVRFLGRRPATIPNRTPTPGATTACNRETITDQAGNFAFLNLAAECQGGQLVRYEGGRDFATVDKQAQILVNQVEEPFDLIHLPRLARGEEVLIEQNAPADQTFEFKSIPGLKIIVYAGTTIRNEDGSVDLPHFRLRAIQVAVDRVPGGIDLEGADNQVVPFLSAFQPANSVASQPIAVYYPNVYGSPPGQQVGLSTLNPTTGHMDFYGRGHISADGTQIVPDVVSGNKRYGLTHLGWHGVVAAVVNAINTAIDTLCVKAGKPVDLASGLESFSVVDMALSSARGSIAITRTYRSLAAPVPTGATAIAPFGRGGSHNYAYLLNRSRPRSFETVNLILPDGNQVPFARNADGTFTNATIPLFRGVVLSTSASDDSSELRFKDGSRWIFISAGNLGSLLSAIVDPNTNRIELRRRAGRLQQIEEVVDPVGRSLRLTYDDADRIRSITDPIGRRVEYNYNNDGALISVKDPENGLTRYEYVDGRSDLLARVYDPRQGPMPIAENEYDANGRVMKQTLADGSTRRFSYVLLNPAAPTSPVRITRVTDGRGNVTTYRFNPQGFLTDVTNPLGQTRVFERVPGSNLLRAVRGSAACNVCGVSAAGDQEFEYDERGNVKSVSNANNETTRFVYHPGFNKVTRVTDALENPTDFEYDGAGNLIAVTDARQNKTRFAYDVFGQLTTILDPLEQVTKIEYDDFGNPIAVTDPLGNRSQGRYDAVSRPVELINALGNSTLTTFDRLDRVTAVIDALGHPTQFEYDAAGNLLVVRDARRNETSFRYDALGRVDQRTDSLQKSDSRKYDLNGNLVEFVDRRGLKSEYTYDALDRLIREKYEDSTVERTYDANGRLVRADDSMGGTFTYTYDAAGRQLSAEGPYGTITYERDALGRVKKRQVVGQPQVDYVYDEVGNLKSATMPATSTTPLVSVSMTYTDRNELERLERSNNVHTAYDYDEVGQVLSIIHANGANVLNEHRYTYDATGNRTSHFNDLAQPLITQAVRSTIDPKSDRLLQRGDVTYSYDEEGHRISERESNRQGALEYGWDSRGRLHSMHVSSDTQIALGRDVRGFLVSIRQSSGLGEETETVILDDRGGAVAIFQGTESQTILSGRAIDEYFAAADKDSVRFGLADGLFSLVAITGPSGSLSGSTAFEPYGSEKARSGEDYPFGFTGRRLISSDIHDYRFRTYDSKAGIFTSEDPLGTMGDGTNLYQYVGSNPVNLVDPMGLSGVYVSFSGVEISGFNTRAGAGNGIAIVGTEGTAIRTVAELEPITLGTPSAIGLNTAFFSPSVGFFLSDISEFENSTKYFFNYGVGGVAYYCHDGGVIGFELTGPGSVGAGILGGPGGVHDRSFDQKGRLKALRVRQTGTLVDFGAP